MHYFPVSQKAAHLFSRVHELKEWLVLPSCQLQQLYRTTRSLPDIPEILVQVKDLEDRLVTLACVASDSMLYSWAGPWWLQTLHQPDVMVLGEVCLLPSPKNAPIGNTNIVWALY